jgi:dTDP-glucose 4,6-dehydratase
MRILVTGAAGFIGSNFVRMIASGELKGFTDVKVLDKLTYAGVVENLTPARSLSSYSFIEGDISDRELVSSLINQVDAVVNFAAESHVDRSILGSDDFIQSNIVGVHVLLDAVKNAGRNIRFLQVSTDEVYGSIASGSWTEESPLKPNSPYSASKASGELLAQAHNKTYGTDVLITRCSNNYGPYQFPEKLIPLFITNLIEGKRVPIYGTGLNVRDWLHVDDHCRALYSVLMDGLSGEVYNIGGGCALSNNEVTSLILDAMGANAASIEYVADRKGHDQRYSLDWTKINRSLGFEPQVKFEDGLRDTIHWYRANESWWKPLKNR